MSRRRREFIEAVEEGIKAADEGRLVDHDAVVAELERRYRSRMRVRWTDPAQTDFLPILGYIARDNPAAERVDGGCSRQSMAWRHSRASGVRAGLRGRVTW